MVSHDRFYATKQWILNIDHYLKTLSRKPRVVKNYTTLHKANSHLQELFENQFVKDAKGFIELLVFAKENGHSHQDIIDAYETLLSHGLRKVSVSQIKAILNHVNSSDDVYIMTTSGGAHAYQIEQQTTETLNQTTRLIIVSKSKAYATTTKRAAAN